MNVRRAGGLPILPLLALLALPGTGPAPARAADPPPGPDSPDSLAQRAAREFAEDTVEGRVRAFRDYARATELAPRREDLWMARGRACAAAGRTAGARACFERASRLDPEDAEAWRALGHAWKCDWLERLDRASLDRARECFERVTRLEPYDADALSSAAAMALLRGDRSAALSAALRANEADPRAATPMLMLGAALYRSGAPALADSAFRAARRRLPGELAARIEGGEFDWAAGDPDLTTPENEARLDYMTRVALVSVLFAVNQSLRWDQRADLFVRYGPPAGVEYNPAAAQLGWDAELEFRYAADATRQRAASTTAGFPYDLQVWHYPDLGLDVSLWDRFLTGEYSLPYSKGRTLEPRPDPEALAARTDVVALGQGRGVFHARAPGTELLPVAAVSSRFPEGGAVRVMGSVRARGGRSDSLWGAWALADSTGRVIARRTRRLEPSICEPVRQQVAGFEADLPAGDYRVDFAVWDGRGHRGVAHRRVHVDPVGAGPRLSDLVLVCGGAAPAAGPEGVRIEPQADDRVGGDVMTLYCEIDGLAVPTDGPAQFRYRSRVFAVDPRTGTRSAGAAYDATRYEDNVGAHRRQFVTAPIRELAPGTYEFVLDVTDRTTDRTATGSLRFVKEGRRRGS